MIPRDTDDDVPGRPVPPQAPPAAVERIVLRTTGIRAPKEWPLAKRLAHETGISVATVERLLDAGKTAVEIRASVGVGVGRREGA